MLVWRPLPLLCLARICKNSYTFYLRIFLLRHNRELAFWPIFVIIYIFFAYSLCSPLHRKSIFFYSCTFVYLWRLYSLLFLNRKFHAWDSFYLVESILLLIYSKTPMNKNIRLHQESLLQKNVIPEPEVFFCLFQLWKISTNLFQLLFHQIVW